MIFFLSLSGWATYHFWRRNLPCRLNSNMNCIWKAKTDSSEMRQNNLTPNTTLMNLHISFGLACLHPRIIIEGRFAKISPEDTNTIQRLCLHEDKQILNTEQYITIWTKILPIRQSMEDNDQGSPQSIMEIFILLCIWWRHIWDTHHTNLQELL